MSLTESGEKLSIEQVAEAFSRHRFELTYEYFLDTIRWDLIGGEQLEGKAAVIGVCNQSATHLAGVVTTFNRFRTVIGRDCVVIESEAEYTDESQGVTTVASCDLYDFIDAKLARITSYTVELG